MVTNDVFTLRRSPFVFFRWFVVSEFLLTLALVILTTGVDLEPGYATLPFARTLSFNLAIVLAITTLQALIALLAFTRWYGPQYSIGRKAIVYHRGALMADTTLVNTQRITRIAVQEGRFGRRLGYGTLLIYTSDTARPARMTDVADPVGVAERIEQLVEPQYERAETSLALGDDVSALIGGGENQYVEFKSSLLWDYQRQQANKDLYEPVMKNIVAFLNTTGGYVIIGVADDGTVLGLDNDLATLPKQNIDSFELVFNNAFRSMVGVEFRHYVDVRFPEWSGKTICVAAVRPSEHPAFLTHKGEESFYIRAGNGSQPLSVSKATRYIQTHFRA